MKMEKGPEGVTAEPAEPAESSNFSVKFLITEDEQRGSARAQGDHFMRIANKVENGEPLSKWDTGYIIAALRIAAKDRYSFTPERPPGRAPKFCHGSMALEYYYRRQDGMSKDAVCAELAESYGVSKEAIIKSLKKQGMYR